MYYRYNVTYDKGFQNDYRKNIGYLINVAHKNKINANESLSVHKKSKLEIYFNSNEISLESFFSRKNDNNIPNIISIDFSHFYSSSLKSLNNLFYSASSMESVDFTNFDTSSVTDMSCVFEYCEKLKFLDLSSFNTSLVTSMTEMFYHCDSLTSVVLSSFDTSNVQKMDYMIYETGSLEYLDISHFNFKNCRSAYLFRYINNLKYLNILYVQNPYSPIVKSDLITLNNLTVCQSENIITNKLANYECCYYNYELNKCESKNYIIITYGQNVEYKFGFIKDKNNNTHEFR